MDNFFNRQVSTCLHVPLSGVTGPTGQFHNEHGQPQHVQSAGNLSMIMQGVVAPPQENCSGLRGWETKSSADRRAGAACAGCVGATTAAGGWLKAKR